MNKITRDILKSLIENSYPNQRMLSEETGYSLGSVNNSLKELEKEGFISDGLLVTDMGRAFYRDSSVRNAIILAAGLGMRMVPINLSTPKALLEVKGEPLIERTIKFLHKKGVKDISVVVGFMKESFEYLIDEYGVQLIVNSEYATKNNLSSLALVADRISNTYIIPSDIVCEENPFSEHEMYSWYMVSEREDKESDVRVNRKGELVKTGPAKKGNHMIGIAYISEKDSADIRRRIYELATDGKHDNDFWEEALYDGDKMTVYGRIINSDHVSEINTYEELRELDDASSHLRHDAIDVIMAVFDCADTDIVDIGVLKKGMTNRSFLFTVHGDKYIMRIPGEGTDMLINRRQEAEVFEAISGLGICDDPIYINPENGYKITRFLNDIRVCDPNSEADLIKCMSKLRKFHEMKLAVSHEFDIFGQIVFYEKLWNGQACIYKDYENTKSKVFSLKPIIEGIQKERCLTHIDAIQDNFLFYKPIDKGNQENDYVAEEQLQLTDWEYAGMQDPHVDIAMFCIYAFYDKDKADRLIDIYFDGNCDRVTRGKIYAYMSMCGLLWSNWCEFKRRLGVEFGEYSLRQYRYAKDFYRYAMDELKDVLTEVE